jgi:carbamate kinase
MIALGGNAIATPASHDPLSQKAAVDRAMAQVAEVVAQGWEVVLTHGNGPQVGDLLRIHELARGVVAPLPLDWCVAETQATIGYLMASSLEDALGRLGLERVVTPVITRVLVDDRDPAWDAPSKPIGEFSAAHEAEARMRAGEVWGDQGPRGWRRLVPSPEPLEIVDRAVIQRLVDEGAVVIAAGGGGIPVVSRNGGRHGAEAVLDKDLTGALLATAVHASCFIIATDVPAAALHYGTPAEEWICGTTPSELRKFAAEGHFALGSMGPKIDAALRFVDAGGGRAVITSLDHVSDALAGLAGTVVES